MNIVNLIFNPVFLYLVRYVRVPPWDSARLSFVTYGIRVHLWCCISCFHIASSQFAWNPNSTENWTLFHRLCKSDFKRYCSRSVLLKKQELFVVIKRGPKPCFTVPLIRENRFNPFDSARLATLLFEVL